MNRLAVLCLAATLIAVSIPGPVQAQRRQSRPATSQQASGLRVTSFSPTGRVPQEVQIVVDFSDDVEGADAAPAEGSDPGYLSFSPSISGVYEWESPRRLRFLPRTGLRLATEYTVKVSSRLKAVSGKTIGGTLEYKFSTPPLQVLGVEQGGYSRERGAVVTLKFNDSIVPADLVKYLTVRQAGRMVKWRPQSDVRSQSVRIITEAVTTEPLSVRIAAGLPASSGPLGLEGTVDRRLELKYDLTILGLEPRWERGKPGLRLTMSDSVTQTDLRKFLTVTPPVEFDAVASYNEIVMTGAFQPDTRYTVTAKSGLATSGGDQFLAADRQLSAWIGEPQPFAAMVEAGGHLSPTGTMQMRVESASVEKVVLRATRVLDENLALYHAFGGDSWNARRLGTRSGEAEIAVTANPKGVVETRVDLRQLLGEKSAGLYLVTLTGIPVESQRSEEGDNHWESRSRLTDSAVLCVSNLGLVGKRGEGEITVWAGMLDTAKPAPGAAVKIFSDKNALLGEGVTGAEGFVTIKGLPPAGEARAAVAVARLGNDICPLDLSRVLSGAEEFPGAGREYLSAGYEAFVTGERGAYRPGETIRAFGIVRGPGVSTPDKAFPLELQIERPDRRLWEPRTVEVSATGRVEFDFVVPAQAPTGLYTARLQLPGTAARAAKESLPWYLSEDDDEYSDSDGEAGDAGQEAIGSAEFFVEEFIPSRLDLKAEAEDRRFATSETLEVSIAAEEMFGQPAGGRTVDAVAFFAAQPFRPTSFDGYTFGDADARFSRRQEQLGETTLDSEGRTTISVTIPDARPPAALKTVVEITVTDTGGRGVTQRIERTIDPVPHYIGARVKADTFVMSGKEALLDLVAVMPGGTLAGDAAVSATVSRVVYNSILKRSGTEFRYETSRELEPLHQATVALAGGQGTLAWTPPTGGQFLLEAQDTASGARTTMMFHATSPEWAQQPWSLEKPERLEVVADKAAYLPGETAKLLVKAPFPGTLLLTLEQNRVVKSFVAEMTANTHELEIPVTEDMLPNVHVMASVVRPVKPAERWLPHRAFGFAGLELSASPRRITVEVSAPEETRPESRLPVQVTLRDEATSAAVAGEVTLWAVDEGILALTAFDTPDPVKFFYSPRKLAVATADFFSELMPDIVVPAGAKPQTGGDGEDEDARRLSPVPAERIKPVSLSLGTMVTAADGTASGTFEVPSFFGRLRVMAVASAGEKFGKGDSGVFVRGPIMVKENLPRFLAPGDKASVPFVLYNNTDAEAPITLTVTGEGPVAIADVPDAPVSVGAGGNKTAIATLTADAPGVAKVGFRGALGAESYGETVELPVRPASPAVRETGSVAVSAGKTESVELPGGKYYPGTTTATLVVSGLPAVELAGSLKYNLEYPYGCVEQTVSAGFPLLHLAALATEMEPDRYTTEGIRLTVQACIDRVLTAQTYSGGLSMWPGSRDPWPWASVYGAHFLVEARKAGYAVPDSSLSELLAYLNSQLALPTPEQADDARGRREAQQVKAYACLVLAIAGDAPRGRMEELREAGAALGDTAGAMLAAAYTAAGSAGDAAALLEPLAKAPMPGTLTRQSGGTLDSTIRGRALVLSALLDADPNAAAVPSLASFLMESRSRGTWGTTQENAFAMVALGKYARVRSAAGPVKATVKWNGKDHEVTQDSSLRIADEALAGASIEVAASEGTVYLHYSVEGVPLEPPDKAVARGLSISRKFMSRDGEELDPSGLAQGKLVVVELHMPAGDAVENVAIEDLLPAGLEIENSNLTTAAGSDEETDEEGVAVRRVEMRDDRMVAFVDLQKSSEPRVFRYAARAVTAGDFVLPPAQAAAMYDPGIEARSLPGRLSVKAR